MQKLISSIDFLLFLLFLSGEGWGATYYIDRMGGDNAQNGLSPISAWKTIAKINVSSFAPGDSVLFKRGETWRESLTVPSSGSAGSPITFGAYGTGAKPIIQPTNVIPGPWTQVGATNVYYATYTSIPIQVFIDNGYCQITHWPAAVGNSTPSFAYPSSNSGDATHLIDNTLQGKVSSDLVGAQLLIYTNPWTQESVTVSAWDTATYSMTISSVSTNPTTSMRYYLTGRVWMITENTWAYDSGTQRLYIWKTDGGDPSTATVEVSGNSSAINATDKSYITIDGLVGRFAGYDGIYMNNWNSNISNINIINSESNYNGRMGILLSPIQRSRGYKIDNSTVYNNVVDHSKEKGILYQGFTSGDDIKNNIVTYSGGVYPQLPGSGMGIHTYLISGVIDNNTISYSAYNGIMYSATNSIITNNTISHTNIFLSDGAGIYGATTGALITYNNLLDTGYGIYSDEVSNNITVEHNTISGGSAGILWHRAYNMTAMGNRLNGPFTSGYAFLVNNDNNTPNIIKYNIINCADNTREGIHLGTVAGSFVNIVNNDILNCKTGLWMENADNVVRNVINNIFYNNAVNIRVASGNALAINYNLYYGTGIWSWGGATKSTFESWKAVSSHDGASITGDPRFFVSTSDFRLNADSPAINAGTNIGLTMDYAGHRVPIGLAPDIGAYELDPSKPYHDIYR